MSKEPLNEAAMRAVIQKSAAVGNAKFVLLLIASVVPEGGTTASITEEELAILSGLSFSGVQSQIRQLKGKKELRVSQSGGQGNRNLYEVAVLQTEGESTQILSTQNRSTQNLSTSELGLTQILSTQNSGLTQNSSTDIPATHNVPAGTGAPVHMNDLNEMHHALNDADFLNLVERLHAAGMHRSTAQRLARINPEECRRQLEYLPYRGEKTNPGGYLKQAIEQGYIAPEGWTPQRRSPGVSPAPVPAAPPAGPARKQAAEQTPSPTTPSPAAPLRNVSGAIRAMEEIKALGGKVPFCKCEASRPGENAATLNEAKTHWVCYRGQCDFSQEAAPAAEEGQRELPEHGPLTEALAASGWASVDPDEKRPPRGRR